MQGALVSDMQNNNSNVTLAEVDAIIDTYEGMLRRSWERHLLEQWTHWKCVRAAMVAR